MDFNLEPWGESSSRGEEVTTLVVVPCSKSKVWGKYPHLGSVRACVAYCGPLFRLHRQYAEREGDRWVILSAKYGFLDPSDLIERYDVSFNHPGSGVVESVLIRQAKGMDLTRFERIIGLGGKRYRDRVREVFGEKTEFPFAGLSLLQLMRKLSPPKQQKGFLK